ncbi:TfuA-like protein [Sinorhizobium medicae]|uniref:TfuA domain protein core n=2 Tax=Sinorhizobium medicae TaxID=110321 RepID=A6UAZ3_SINMW|nr:TfuA-like protein [Sinorhizobium medicae]ABR60823.1 TfuA domain protein core [Sinorhizobium medicae WSM419]MBO1964936.1 TfuA-like protein [Sinorhizobium medicae]MDX0406981.1 TfuA domain-containing protein [Sinorhizobium medicae]MDX0412592.1 TfuA domain-containing protein [Sinorhizobium medicae]MDX0418691.1 TfuA domain-containing protein [Sinorhizobium medicae]
MAADGPILVFLGPTLRLAEAEKILDAVYLQPAAQGDFLLAAHAFRPSAMVLIDGQFQDRPAVRHKEILWAMAQGIVVIGAASMGALRAAELDAFGMIGVGLIYRWYRRFSLGPLSDAAPDDAIAVLSGPPELGFLPLTDALVDLQRTFFALSRSGVILPSERDRLTTIARDLNFRERSLAAVFRAAGRAPDRSGELRAQIIGQKRRDALDALRKAPVLLAQHRQAHRADGWIATNTFLRDLEAGGIDSNLVNTYKLKP